MHTKNYLKSKSGVFLWIFIVRCWNRKIGRWNMTLVYVIMTSRDVINDILPFIMWSKICLLSDICSSLPTPIATVTRHEPTTNDCCLHRQHGFISTSPAQKHVQNTNACEPILDHFNTPWLKKLRVCTPGNWSSTTEVHVFGWSLKSVLKTTGMNV